MIETVNQYAYPVNMSVVEYTVDETSSGSHEGSYRGSVDFAVPIGTTVLAAADGEVTRVRDDSEKHGSSPEFGTEANYITIAHANNEFSEYLHLAMNSATVRVGDKVEAGQKIAETGLSGWLFAPHLHFMVYAEEHDFACRKIRFVAA